jgi:hypothetical protein
VLLVFDAVHAASLMLLKPGGPVEARGTVLGMERNPFGVPQLVLSRCEILETAS